MDAIVRDCWFVSQNLCEGTELAPEEQIRVDRTKSVKPLPADAPGEMIVCGECASGGWDEIEGYVVPDDYWDGSMPSESMIYPLDR